MNDPKRQEYKKKRIRIDDVTNTPKCQKRANDW